MPEITTFMIDNKIFSFVMIVLNIILSGGILKKSILKTSESIIEAKGNRLEEKTLYKKCAYQAKKHVIKYEKKYDKTKIYNWAENIAKKTGFKGEHAAFLYLFLQFGLPILIFIIILVLNDFSCIEAFKVFVFTFIGIVIMILKNKKNLNMKLQRYGYKIYKYLNNQVASGIKTTDAIKTVYEVIDDKDLRNIFLRMAANYELTLDIDLALEEFKSVYDAKEAESFCIAIKQGIITGDNSELLARQESVMFKKYFNFIQAETDACKTKSVLAAVVFTAIIVAMILIPFFFEASEAMGKLFLY